MAKALLCATPSATPHVTAAASVHTIHITLWRSAAPGQVQELQLQMPLGSTAAQALAQAGWPVHQPCGVWGRLCPVEQPLADGDRLELYRALTVDPKVARRERFSRQGARAAGLFSKRRLHSKAGY